MKKKIILVLCATVLYLVVGEAFNPQVSAGNRNDGSSTASEDNRSRDDRREIRRKRCRRYAEQFYKPFQRVPAYKLNYEKGYVLPNVNSYPPRYVAPYMSRNCYGYCYSCPTSSCRRRCPVVYPSVSIPPKVRPGPACNCNPDGAKFNTCDVITGRCVCKPHYTGRTCDICQDAFRKNGNKECVPCDCNPHGCTSKVCDKATGRCRCKQGVTGNKCDKCLPNHYGSVETKCKECNRCDKKGHICDNNNGECVCPPLTIGKECDRCSENSWGFETGAGCKPCECSFAGSDSLQCDQTRGKCTCKNGFEGDKCDKCSFGHYGLNCEKCDCDGKGTNEWNCRNGLCNCGTEGNCECKKNVHGKNCNVCKPNTFGLSRENPDGCTNCFCFGRSTECKESSLKWDKIRAADSIHDHHDDNVANAEWSLPRKFLGDLTASYGGYLTVSLPVNSRFQVQLKGNSVQLFADSTNEIQMIESAWRVLSTNPEFSNKCGRVFSRECFMIVLQRVTSIVIKANNRIEEVLLDTAKPNLVGNSPTRSIEECDCIEEYAGLSCQDPNQGYYRNFFNDSNSSWIDRVIGTAVPCECNGRSNVCDPNTGHCKECKDRTTGYYCELCEDGYYKNANGQCLPCLCPSETQNHALGCSPRSNAFICECKQGYNGDLCDSCQEGYYDLDLRQDVLECVSCGCNPFGTIDFSCSFDGRCQCKIGFKGSKCDQCVNEREYIKEGVCVPCDECTQKLFAEIDRLTSTVDETFLLFKDGLNPPWKVLTNTMAKYKVLSEKFKKKVTSFQTVLEGPKIDECEDRVSEMEIQLEKDNSIAKQNQLTINAVIKDSKILNKELNKLETKLKDIIGNLENFGTKHINLHEALKRARKILKAIQQLSKKFDELEDQKSFDFCTAISDKVNIFYKPPLTVPIHFLEELDNKLNNLVDLTENVEAVGQKAEEKNLINAERLKNVKEKIELLDDKHKTVKIDIDFIIQKVNKTNELMYMLEAVYKDLSNIVNFEEFKILEKRIRRQEENSPNLSNLYLEALDHVQKLGNTIKVYQGMFNFTNDEWKKINASGSFEAIAQGIQNAKKDVEESQNILQKVVKIMAPKGSDSIVDNANLHRAYSDRLKQRITNLKNISQNLIGVRNRLDDFKYSILESGKANNDLTQILHKIESDITSQGSRVDKLGEAIQNATSISNEMGQIEKDITNLQYTSQHNFFKKYQTYINETSREEIDNLRSKLLSTTQNLQKLNIIGSKGDDGLYANKNKMENLKAIQKKIEGLRNKIFHAKHAANMVNVAMNLTNCSTSYKIPQTEVFRTLDITYNCETCTLFKWRKKSGEELVLTVNYYVLTVFAGNNKPTTVSTSPSTLGDENTLTIEVKTQSKQSQIIVRVKDSVNTVYERIIPNISKEFNFIDCTDEMEVGHRLKETKGNSYVYRILLNGKIFGLWNFASSSGSCAGQTRHAPTATQEITYYHGLGYRKYGFNTHLNPAKVTFTLDFSTFDENSLLYMARGEECSYIAVYLNDGLVNFFIQHNNGIKKQLNLLDRYNDGNKHQIEFTMSFVRSDQKQFYKLQDKDTNKETEVQQILKSNNVFKIKKATHYLGGVPPTFDYSCTFITTRSFLGFLKINPQLTNETLFHDVSDTEAKLTDVWIYKNGFIDLQVPKLKTESLKTISFVLRQQESGVVMSLGKYGDVVLVNNLLRYKDIEYNLEPDKHNIIELEIRPNGKESYNEGPISFSLGKEKGGFTGGISKLFVNNDLLLLNSTTVREFANVQFGREPSLMNNCVGNVKSLLAFSMQNTEGCAVTANYNVDPEAVKFGDKPNSYTFIRTKNNFWKEDHTLSFKFRTVYPNGLLFISIGKQRTPHFLYLQLSEGNLELNMNTKRSKRRKLPKTIKTILFGNKLNDGRWHEVEIIKKKKKLSIKLDDQHPKSVNIPKYALRDEIYFGGVNTNSNYIDVANVKDKIHAFRGCMKSLKINEEPKFLVRNNKDVEHFNITQCFPYVEKGAYFGGDAFAVYKENFMVNKILELSFEFRTAEQNGILLSVSNQGNYPAVSIELQNGAVVMAVDMGNGAVSNVTNNLDSDFALCNNMWHNVTAMYSSSELTVNVDGIRKSWVQSDVGSLMYKIDAPLYIGGKPDRAPVGTLKSEENFKGCIRKLKIEDKLMDWSDMKYLNNVLLNSCPTNYEEDTVDNILDNTSYTLI